jgi:hypothetical protein
MLPELVLPTIHMNGTSARCLLEGYMEARSAVMRASEAIQAIEFNARDYYPQGGNAFRVAQEQHVSRMKRLAEISDELLRIAEHVSDALPVR